MTVFFPELFSEIGGSYATSLSYNSILISKIGYNSCLLINTGSI